MPTSTRKESISLYWADVGIGPYDRLYDPQ